MSAERSKSNVDSNKNELEKLPSTTHISKIEGTGGTPGAAQTANHQAGEDSIKIIKAEPLSSMY